MGKYGQSESDLPYGFVIIKRAYRYEMYMAMLTGILTVVLAFIFISLLGFWGAIVALLLMQFYQTFIQDLFLKRYRLNSITAWKSLFVFKQIAGLRSRK